MDTKGPEMTKPFGYNEFSNKWQSNAKLAMDTIALRPTQGIPTWLFQTMEAIRKSRAGSTWSSCFDRESAFSINGSLRIR